MRRAGQRLMGTHTGTDKGQQETRDGREIERGRDIDTERLH